MEPSQRTRTQQKLFLQRDLGFAEEMKYDEKSFEKIQRIYHNTSSSSDAVERSWERILSIAMQRHDEKTIVDTEISGVAERFLEALHRKQ
jgi:hypothetical protein